MKELLNLKDISKKYYIGKQTVVALDSVSLKVESGDFLAITGSSGSGKSTLMNILGFLDTPDSGSYIFDGKQRKSLSEKKLSDIRGKRIGFIFQSFHLLPNLTAYQNVELPLIYNHISFKKRRKICENALTRVGLKERMDHKPGQLSGGQKQRVAIARAIALSPPLILADEPTGNLDPISGEEVINTLLSLNNEGTTVIMITHDRSLADKAKRKIEISAGKIV